MSVVPILQVVLLAYISLQLRAKGKRSATALNELRTALAPLAGFHTTMDLALSAALQSRGAAPGAGAQGTIVSSAELPKALSGGRLSVNNATHVMERPP